MPIVLATAGVLFTACCLTAGAQTNAAADPQGWNGPGWYITGSAPAASQAAAAPDYILFEGPHEMRSTCLEIYDRFYSPVGVCRFLDAKPLVSVR